MKNWKDILHYEMCTSIMHKEDHKRTKIIEVIFNPNQRGNFHYN
jgi:hypothetical protein